MQFRTWKPIAVATLACLSALAATSARSQTVKSGTPPVRESRIDLFAGYSYLHPVSADINYNYDQPIDTGTLLSVAGYFNRYIGVQAEGGLHPGGPNDCVYTAQGGPIVRYQMRRFVPFAHALGGGAKVGGPVFPALHLGLRRHGRPRLRLHSAAVSRPLRRASHSGRL